MADNATARMFAVDTLTDQERHAALYLLCESAPDAVDEVLIRLATARGK
jgi:hypothetical protein